MTYEIQKFNFKFYPPSFGLFNFLLTFRVYRKGIEG